MRISLSLLDRLVNDGSEPQLSEMSYPRLYRESVQRDLNNLLNTRRDIIELPADLPAVNKSIAAYGVPDFTAVNVNNYTEQNRVRRSIEEAIRLFEPRLTNVTVVMLPMSQTERLLRFRIDARLRMEEESEPVEFDAALHISNSTFSVRE